MKYKAILAVLFLSLLVLPIVLSALPLLSASQSSLGSFKMGECISLKQSCATCTYNIITRVLMPDSTEAIAGAYTMNKVGTAYDYTFCNTSQAGNYIVDGYGDLAGTDTIWNYNFQVSATGGGGEISTGKSLTYIFIFIFALFMFIALFFIGISAPYRNKTDEMTGYVIAVSNIKYAKLTCLGLSWVLGMFIMYLAWMITFSFLQMPFVSDIFHWIFYVMAALTLPFFILFTYLVIANLVRDSQIGEALSRGFQVNAVGLPH